MTRINLIPPSELHDQHLVAEYREIQRIPSYLRRSLNRATPFDVSEIPDRFTLNKGHVKFFYDKLGYIQERYNHLADEMKNRGMNVNCEFPDLSDLPKWTKGEYSPTERALRIIRNRIKSKVDEKPNWYKKTKGE